MKNAGCPPNIGGRAGEPMAPVRSTFRSWMLIRVEGVCGGSARFQRAITGSIAVSPSLSNAWLNLLKVPSSLSGERKLFKS